MWVANDGLLATCPKQRPLRSPEMRKKTESFGSTSVLRCRTSGHHESHLLRGIESMEEQWRTCDILLHLIFEHFAHATSSGLCTRRIGTSCYIATSKAIRVQFVAPCRVSWLPRSLASLARSKRVASRTAGSAFTGALVSVLTTFASETTKTMHGEKPGKTVKTLGKQRSYC